MTSPGERVEVTAEELTAAGTGAVRIAEQTQRDASGFSGTQEAITGLVRGFDLVAAGAECEASWQRAIDVTAAKLALDGDNLSVNAANYVATEAQNTANLRGTGSW
ncbi:hypothetical protein [Actinokineospora sp. HUAS TT18]|uniref:hypothetical protein n=1 Tax=Actinokineospora sp. HUAS TT18 TaxID=3447451 RepID=UPI003F5286FF